MVGKETKWLGKKHSRIFLIILLASYQLLAYVVGRSTSYLAARAIEPVNLSPYLLSPFHLPLSISSWLSWILKETLSTTIQNACSLRTLSNDFCPWMQKYSTFGKNIKSKYCTGDDLNDSVGERSLERGNQSHQKVQTITMVVKPHRLPYLHEGGSMITKRIKHQSIHHHPMVIIVGRSLHYTIRSNDARTKRKHHSKDRVEDEGDRPERHHDPSSRPVICLMNEAL